MSAKMPGDTVTVKSLVSGRAVAAVKLKCKDCKADKFLALLIGPQRDLHLQCLACGESHCAHDGECHKEESLES